MSPSTPGADWPAALAGTESTTYLLLDTSGVPSTVWLAAAIGTHLAVGLAVGTLAATVDDRANPRYGLVGAGLPDLDFLLEPLALGWPLVHRGLLHTPAFWVVVLGVLALTSRSRRALAPLAAGLLSHLVIDSLTPKGVVWLYPLSGSVGVSTGVHSYAGDAILLALSGLVVLLARDEWGGVKRRGG